MASVALDRLLRGKAGLMINGVTLFRRAAAGLTAASLVAALGAPARAQSTDDGWFDDGTGQAPEPAPSAPTSPRPSPRAPAPPARGAEPQALAPSPLLERDAEVGSSEDQDPRALSAWNSYIDPYGSWVDDSRYGRVWMPSDRVVGTEFAPYSSGGHWALDENDDWVWMSDYPFGWVTFHYGRWVWIGGRGWAWIPGMRYAPAWVTWRTPIGSYGYVGWAPLPPAYLWFGGGAIVYGYDPLYPWVFCPSEYVFSARVHSYIVRDRYTMGYAARYTRPYYVAPRGGSHYVAAPHGPSPAAAHVPARTVPTERVSSRSIATRGSVSAGMSTMQQRDFATRNAAPRAMDQRRLDTRSARPLERGEPMRRELSPARGESLRPDAYRPEPARHASPAPAWNGSHQSEFTTRHEVAPRPAPRSAPPRPTRASPAFGGTHGGGGSHGHGRR